MHKYLLIFALSSLFAQAPSMELPDNKKIAVQNTILTKVNDTTISVIDVKKKLDLMFYQNYSHLSHSNQARLQFYESGWRAALMQMIDNELILSDAAAKEVKQEAWNRKVDDSKGGKIAKKITENMAKSQKNPIEGPMDYTI